MTCWSGMMLGVLSLPRVNPSSSSNFSFLFWRYNFCRGVRLKVSLISNSFWWLLFINWSITSVLFTIFLHKYFFLHMTFGISTNMRLIQIWFEWCSQNLTLKKKTKQKLFNIVYLYKSWTVNINNLTNEYST